MVYPRRIAHRRAAPAHDRVRAPAVAGCWWPAAGRRSRSLARDPRIRYGAAAVALIAAPALVAGDVWHSTRLVDLRHHPAKLARSSLVAVVSRSASARRSSAASAGRFPVSVFAALPLRVPVQLGGQTVAPAGPAVSGDRRRPGVLRVRGAGRRAGRGRRRPPGRGSLDAEPCRPAGGRLAVPRARSDAGAVRDPDRLLGGCLERDRERLLLPGPVRGDAHAPRRGALDRRGSWAGC